MYDAAAFIVLCHNHVMLQISHLRLESDEPGDSKDGALLIQNKIWDMHVRHGMERWHLLGILMKKG
jgi:hypothetical protein